MRTLLVSTYELGHQPLHVASPAAALLAAGHEVRGHDLFVEQWDPAERPRLTEAWFCCAEPTAGQLGALRPVMPAHA